MRIFVCEFITGGGWQDRELPASLAHEGEMMLTVLLDDLQDAGYRDLVCTRDGRLTALPHDIDTVIPAANAWDTWESIMRECDAAWIIAPETDAVLFRLVQLAEYCNCRIIGCSAGTVRMATSKQRTAGWLQKHHIPTEPVFNDPEQLSENREGWIVKPDDGVGGEEVWYFPDLPSLRSSWQRQSTEKKQLIQQFIPGVAASMCLLCHAGDAILLGCNEQRFIFRNDGKGELQSVIVNGLRQYHDAMAGIAGKLAGAMPGETAFIGVDLVITDQGLIVIEINPRLTTSYAGLHQSLGINPAGLILSLMQGGNMPDVHDFQYHPVRINI